MASAESIVYGALRALVEDRVYPDEAPFGAVRPYIVYQAVGGQDTNTTDGPADLQNCRMQVAVWADSRAVATSTMRAAFAALTVDAIRGVPIGAPVSTYESDTKLYGSRLDYSLWFTP